MSPNDALLLPHQGSAVEHHELPADTDVATVVELLNAMVWGIGFYAGFVDVENNMTAIAKQLHRLLGHGLLDGPASCRSLTIDPHAPAAVAWPKSGARPFV